MTYLLISKNKEKQEEKLKELLAGLLDKNVSKIEQTPDIHILDRSNENSIGIEEIKNFIKEMIFRPFGDTKQVAIIYEAEKLTIQAQNSLLKTLEESGDDTIYILCVDNEKNVIPTIYSRSKPIFVKQPSSEKNQDYKKPEILTNNLVEQFANIDLVSKEKQLSLDLLDQIEGYFKLELEKEIKNDNINSSRTILEILKHIQDTREKIDANCNKKLVLEALFVYLNA